MSSPAHWRLSDFSGRNYQPLLEGLRETKLEVWARALASQLPDNLSQQRYGDLPRWLDALQQLPDIPVADMTLQEATVGFNTDGPLGVETRQQLRTALQALHPWRKGPFSLAGVHIDTEWRSDLKWDRLKDAIEPLHGRTVLDVGCGSGYHCWRMAGAGAELVIGIEPTPLFVMQFWALQRYLQQPSVWVVPQRIEQVPDNLRAFDSVFSMGILYHRRSPFEHLQSLRQALRSEGQLVLETLVVDEDGTNCLVPEGRYAKMGNVWFIPSVASLEIWLRKMKFTAVRCVDVSVTSPVEQRATDWMRFESLRDFLHPDDSTLTVEGYPAPKRAVFTATAP